MGWWIQAKNINDTTLSKKMLSYLYLNLVATQINEIDFLSYNFVKALLQECLFHIVYHSCTCKYYFPAQVQS